MQRDIKCRGILKSDAKTWVVGAYYKHQRVTLCPIGLTKKDIKDNELHLIIKSGFIDWNMPDGLDCHEVLSETVGLCTELLDKNGKEIYEGDIYYQGTGNMYVVVWYGTSLIGKQYNTSEDTYSPLPMWRAYIEVIGNITDNPELLA